MFFECVQFVHLYDLLFKLDKMKIDCKTEFNCLKSIYLAAIRVERHSNAIDLPPVKIKLPILFRDVHVIKLNGQNNRTLFLWMSRRKIINAL